MSFKYQSLSLDDEKYRDNSSDRSSSVHSLEAALLTGENDSKTSDGPSRRWRSNPYWMWLIHVVLLLSSSSMFLSSLYLRSSTLACVREFSAYSPAAAAVEYQPVRFNVTTKGNRFSGAGPEVDKAWQEISYDMGDQMISPAQLAKLDMPTTSLKVTHPKTGVEGYRVGVEAFHQLHCINLLRRITYRDYYEPLGGEFARGKEALQMHTDHCLEILRLNTQCNADIGLFSFYMVPGDPLAWPELNSNHMCRNFDKVMDWAVSHSVGNMEVLAT